MLPQSIIESGISVLCTDGSELISRKTDKGRGKHSEQRNLIIGIIHHTQQAHDKGDLSGREEAFSPTGNGGNTLLQESLPVCAADCVGIAQKNRNITKLNAAGTFRGGDGCFTLYQLKNSLRYIRRFHSTFLRRKTVIILLGHLNQTDFRKGDGIGVALRPVYKSCGFIISNVTQLI